MSYSWLLLLPILVMIAVGIVYWFEEHMLFSPVYYREEEALHTYPSAFHGIDLGVESDVKLEGMVYEPQEGFWQTVLYFGGKEQDSVGLLVKLSQHYPNTRFVTFNYRSYGKSMGKPSQANLYGDALDIYEYVHAHYGVDGVMGYSLGSSVASYLSSKRQVPWLVLIGAFDSIKALAMHHYKIHFSFLARHPFNTIEYVKNINAPLYLFVSVDDAIVPIDNARNLSENVKNLVVYKEFSGYNHDEILFSDEVVKALKEGLNL